MVWARHVGGPGLIVLALVDNSAIPIPGSEDVLTVILSASQKTLWPYYAFMATVGAMIGGFITYQLAHREGKALLEARRPCDRPERHASPEARAGAPRAGLCGSPWAR